MVRETRSLLPRWIQIGVLLALAGAAAAFAGRLPAPSRANGNTAVRIEPSSQQVLVDETSTTDVVVEDVADLYGYEFEISFDPAKVAVVDASPTFPGVQIRPGDFLSPDWILQNTADNGAGTIAFALSQRHPSAPRDGSGTLATITWHGDAVGNSPITLTYVSLSAPGGVSIPSQVEDGQITVMESYPVPTITGLTPISTTVGVPGFSLTVHGSGFVLSSTVHFGGEMRPTEYVSTTRLTAGIMTADVAEVGTQAVTVTNPSPGGGPSNTMQFDIAPVPDDLEPSVYLPFVVGSDE